MRAFETEAQLAATVVDWLKRGGWDVYQEVQLNSGGRRADIIAVDCLERICVLEGLGILKVSVSQVRETQLPTTLVKTGKSIIPKLHEQHKNFAGSFYTP